MNASSRTQKIRLLVALVAGCGGKIELGQDDAGISSVDDDGCPRRVEIRRFAVALSPEAACTLATRAPPCFGFFCQPGVVDCVAVCGDPAVNACQLPASYASEVKRAGGDAASACPELEDDRVELTCIVSETRGRKRSGCPVEGRRPAGLRPAYDETSATNVGAYFAECAWLEAASVDAFRDLARALERADAPRDLVVACEAAARDEESHAVAVARLARRFGAEPVRPERPVPGSRRLLDLAIDNAVEGLVRETFGAAVALFRAMRSGDDAVRETMRAIAEDECAHAELAERLDAFFATRLSPHERGFVAEARAAAVAALFDEASSPVVRSLREIAGVPSVTEARALLDGLAAEVWAA